MANAQETIADIIAEMRGFKCRNLSTGELEECTAISKYLADRLEAARKRERGDCTKLREALEKVRHLMPYFLQYMRLRWEDAGGGGYYESINKTITAALAAPPRQCDVGTAKEQAARMRAFCAKNGLCRDGAYRCENCGLLHEFRCELAWAQMPYEEGGAK